jgi:hypothetical protein
MSSEAAFCFAEALTNSSKGRWCAQAARVRHVNPRLMQLHMRTLRDARRLFFELCVNRYPRTDNILVNGADNQRQMADLSDYNVAHNSQNNPEFCRKPSCFLSRSGAL